MLCCIALHCVVLYCVMLCYCDALYYTCTEHTGQMLYQGSERTGGVHMEEVGWPTFKNREWNIVVFIGVLFQHISLLLQHCLFVPLLWGPVGSGRTQLRQSYLLLPPGLVQWLCQRRACLSSQIYQSILWSAKRTEWWQPRGQYWPL